jgi:glycosidase
VLRDFGQYVRSIAPQSCTIGEVWDNTDMILTYYPDELDAYFAFPVSEALLNAVKTGKAGNLLATVARFQAAVPAYRFAPFQRNHDQTRTMTALGNDTAGVKLAATIVLTLPGVPFIYYGEEIGMTGDKPDERLRTPMQWTRTSAGFTSGTAWEAPQSDTLMVNVAAESGDSSSVLSFYRRLLAERAKSSALRDGELVPVETGNDAILAYIRRDSLEAVLVAANLGTTPYMLRSPLTRRLAPRRAYLFSLAQRR